MNTETRSTLEHKWQHLARLTQSPRRPYSMCALTWWSSSQRGDICMHDDAFAYLSGQYYFPLLPQRGRNIAAAIVRVHRSKIAVFLGFPWCFVCPITNYFSGTTKDDVPTAPRPILDVVWGGGSGYNQNWEKCHDTELPHWFFCACYVFSSMSHFTTVCSPTTAEVAVSASTEPAEPTPSNAPTEPLPSMLWAHPLHLWSTARDRHCCLYTALQLSNKFL